MRVTALRLVNFRNYPSLSLRPDAGLCVLTGENAAGKTNVLESLFLCSLGRSHRTTRDGELVRMGESAGSVAVDVDKRYAEHVAGKGARYTRSHPPRRLLARFEHPDRSAALKAEYAIKQLSANDKRAHAQGPSTA